MKKRILRPLPGMDLPFLILVLTLVGFGLVMLASASSAVARSTGGATPGPICGLSCSTRRWGSAGCGWPAG